MKLAYTVSKEKGGQWYCHQVGFQYVPVFGSFGDKKKALHVAAKMCGLPYKEYMQLRQKDVKNDKGRSNRKNKSDFRRVY